MTNTRITANFYPSTFGNDIPTYLQESVSSSPSPYATSGPPINRLLHIYTINSTVAMAFLGMRTFAKKWPTPVLKPMGPFIIAGGIIFYGINSFQNLLMNTEEFRNDPRNPNAGKH